MDTVVENILHPSKEVHEISATVDNAVVHDGQIRGRYNMQQIGRAIENGWPITEADRGYIISEMLRVTRESKSNRARISASKVLVAMTGVNARLLSIDQKTEMGPNQINILNQINQGETACEEADLRRLTLAELEQLRQLQAKVAGQPGPG